MRWILNKQNVNKHPETMLNNILYTTSIINMGIILFPPLERALIRRMLAFNLNRRKWKRITMLQLGIIEMKFSWQEGKSNQIEIWRRIIWHLVSNKLEPFTLHSYLVQWALTQILHHIHLHLSNSKEAPSESYKWILPIKIPQGKASNSMQDAR
jgi:hypothetical protein